MESTSKFNLEKSLAQWKNGLYQDDSLTEDTISELESHLLDTIDDLARKDLDEEEAFFIALRRLGDTKLLVREFEKVDNNLLSFNRTRFFIVGIIFSCFLSEIIKVIFLTGEVARFYLFNTYESLSMAFITSFILIVIGALILHRLLILKRIKTLGIFGNIPFLVSMIILSRVSFFVFMQQSSSSISIYGKAMAGIGYITISTFILIIILALFIHIKAKKRKLLVL